MPHASHYRWSSADGATRGSPADPGVSPTTRPSWEPRDEETGPNRRRRTRRIAANPRLPYNLKNMQKPAGPLRFGEILAQEYSELLKDRVTPPPPDGDAGTLYRYAHNLADDAAITGLCISGGGIRSATFGLGVLHGLALKGLLGRFDYLSTVSGGGYIGSWLKAWQKNDPASYKHCLQDCSPGDPERPEPTAIRHLRSYSNYLAPEARPVQRGQLDADRHLPAEPAAELGCAAAGAAGRGIDCPGWGWAFSLSSGSIPRRGCGRSPSGSGSARWRWGPSRGFCLPSSGWSRGGDGWRWT